MVGWAKDWGKYLNEAAKRSAEYSERHFRFLGALAIVVPAAYVVDYYVGQPHFDTLAIRCIAFLLALPLVAYNSPFIRSFSRFHLYFVLMTAYVLPFTFGLMLVLNAASAPTGERIEMLWILQYVISLFLFIQLIHNGPLATVLWSASTAAAGGSLLFLENVNWSELQRVMVYPISGYLTALFFGIITNRNVDYVNSEKLKAASAIGGNIAHELRTPLASIRSLARGVRKHSETLVEAYDRAKAAGITVGNLNRSQVESLRTALASIEQEVTYSNTVIDMLLLNTSGQAHQDSAKETLDIVAMVNEAISRYPFNNSHEKQILSLRASERFHVHASPVLMVHVFFNLLKNSIFYAQKRAKGSVEILIEGRDGRGIVSITDTGPGMSSQTRRHVFDRFYTTATACQGAGIGLSFCKTVMESLGGEIQCESREGEYTTFRLIFPTVDGPEALDHDDHADAPGSTPPTAANHRQS